MDVISFVGLAGSLLAQTAPKSGRAKTASLLNESIVVFVRLLIQFVTRERSAEKAIVKYFQRKRNDQLQQCVLARRHATIKDDIVICPQGKDIYPSRAAEPYKTALTPLRSE
jgi:hypothetical protein